jgi:hypothetical protein
MNSKRFFPGILLLALPAGLFGAGCLNESLSTSGALSQGTLNGAPPKSGLVNFLNTPGLATNLTIASFIFELDSSATTTTCQVDKGAAYSCTSPVNLINLSDGLHRLTITPSVTGDADPIPAVYQWLVKTLPPQAPTLDFVSVVSHGDTATITGACTFDSVAVDVTGSETGSTACAGGRFAYVTQNRADDATYYYSFKARDAAGNISTAAANGAWTRDTGLPTAVFSTIPSTPSTSTSATWAWLNIRDNAGGSGLTSIDFGLHTNSTCTAPVLAEQYTGMDPVTTTGKTFNSLTAGVYFVKLTVRDAADNVATACRGGVQVDLTAPTISALTLNGGATTSASNFLSAQLTAGDGTGAGVSSMRLSFSATFADDSWQIYSGAVQPLVVPFGAATRTLYAWVKDGAGNISDNDGTTAGYQPRSVSIAVNPANAPIVSVLRPVESTVFTSGQNVHVEWSASGTSLASAPIFLAYTTDGGVTRTPMPSTALNNAVNGGCSLVASGTGCSDFALPAGLVGVPFQVIVQAVDSRGARGAALGPLLNNASLKRLAGKTSHAAGAIGGSALQTALKLDGSGELALASNGDLYAAGQCQIYRIDGATGNTRVYVGDRSCSATGNGAAPSAATGVAIGANGSIALDPQGNLYWTDTGGVRRVNASTGFVEQYVGGGADAAPETGVLRSAVNLSATSLTFDSQGRLYFVADFGGGDHAVVYRVNGDDKLERIAGNFATTNVPIGGDARQAGLGSWKGRAAKISLRPITGDLLFMQALDGLLYSIDPLTSVAQSVAANWAGLPGQLVWDASRSRLLAGGASGVGLVRADMADTFTLATAGDAGAVKGIARDAYGGIYYTTRLSRRIHYLAPDNSAATFAGVDAASSANGTAAALVDLRSPSQLSYVSGTGVYLDDSGTQTLRLLKTNGTIDSVRATGAAAGVRDSAFVAVSSTVQLYAGYRAAFSITNLSTPACQYFCGPSATTFYGAANGTAAGTLAIPRATNQSPYVAGLAYDSVANSIFVEGFDPATATPFVSEISPTTGNIIRRMGVAGSSVLPTVGGSVASSSIDRLPSVEPMPADRRMQAHNGTVYRLGADGQVWKLLVAGNASIETPAGTAASSFLVDGANSRIYWVENSTLYARALGVSTARETLAVLPARMAVGSKGINANTLLLIAGDQIIEFQGTVSTVP